VVAPRKTKWHIPPTLADVYKEFRRWLYLDSTDAIDIMLATAISQQIDGEPIWMFLVGPPGSAKTETLSSLSWVENAYMTSSLTPHSLISGASWKDAADPSLIPKLNGKIMVIKDFTSILSMRDTEKDEIFGILRDAYDGKCGKEFGNGVVRNYESRFTIMAAVTPSIYALSSSHTALGERFLKFGIGDNLLHRSEDAIIERAISNINQETTMRADLADAIHAFLARRLELKKILSVNLPVIPDDLKTKIIALARFGARMRGTVTRDTYRNDIITSRPSAEVGSRLGKQLAKLVQALALVRQKKIVGAEEYRLAKKVMLDTIPQRTEDILRHILLTCPTATDTMTTADIHAKSRYPVATVGRIMQDLTILDIAKRVVTKTGPHHGNATSWTLSDYIRGIIKKAGLYRTDEELDRPVRMSIRVVKRRKKS
jgi:predicted nucleic acid-binding protein